MAETFRHYPQAIANTMLIKEMCTGWKLELGKPMLPNFPLPEGQDVVSYFLQVARDGLNARFEEAKKAGRTIDHAAYHERLEMELKVIVGMKFPGYFLIVWDFNPLCERERHSGGAGAWLRRGLARRVCDAHHRPRPDALRPVLRALPEPGTHLDARLRRRLLHGPARGGHQVRGPALRPEFGGTDRDLPRAEGAQRDQGRCPRKGGFSD